jgi:hypothetical protein
MSDAKDDALESWKDRCREILKTSPSRDACRVKLSNEGANADLIPVILEQVFAERKSRSQEKQSLQDNLLIRLSAIIDGRASAEDHEGELLGAVAEEKLNRLNKEISQYGWYLFWCLLVFVLVLAYLAWPIIVAFVIAVKSPAVGTAIWPVFTMLSASVGSAIYSAQNYLIARRRRDALMHLAHRFGWW